MTIKLRATVYRNVRPPRRDDHLPWSAVVWATEDGFLLLDANDRMFTRYAEAATMPDALAASYELQRDLDRALMAEVHESRASRRAVNIPICAPECRMTPPYTHAPECERYTEEATA